MLGVVFISALVFSSVEIENRVSALVRFFSTFLRWIPPKVREAQ
jgi:hypothetical protein